MGNFIFRIQEPVNYQKRSINSQKINLLIALVIFICVVLASNWVNGLIIAMLFFFIQFFKLSHMDKYYIVCIKKKKESLNISYKKTNKFKQIGGNIKDFRIKKKISFNRTKTPYLAVYYKKKLIIKQFEIGEWNENKFDEIVTSIS